MKKVILFFATLLALSQTAFAYDFSYTYQGQTLYYNIVSGNARVTKQSVYAQYNYSSLSGNVSIPASVTYGGTTYSVTSIDHSTFEDCDGITSVTIPNTITQIGNLAFGFCSGLTSVSFNADSCTNAGYDNGIYHNSAFYGCPNITSFSFGNNVMVIPSDLCYGLSGITSVTIPNSVVRIGQDAFKNCSGLINVEFNADSCTYAGSTSSTYSGYNFIAAFINCPNITSFNFGNNVKVIPENLCYGLTGLASITIPRAVTSIGYHAFYGCSGLVSVTFNADSCGSLGTITPKPAFVNCPNLTSITFGNNVKVIPSNLCMYLSSLTSVNIPDSVISIGAYAFQNCSGMTSVTIGNGVTVISNYAFSGCSGLSSVTIPNSVTTLAATSFHNCTGLTSVTFNADSCTSSATQSSFRYCPNIISFTFGNNVKVIPPNLCCQLSNLTSITCNAVIPPTVANASSFSGVPRNIPLRVPIASISSYQSAPVWNEFTNCIGIGDTITATVTATISEIESTSAHADIVMGQHTSYFYYFYAPQSFIQNQLTTDEAIINYVNQYFGASERNYNDVSEYMSGLTPSTEYLLVAVPYNSNDEVGTVCRTQFTTLGTTDTATVTATISEIESTSAHADIVMGQHTSYFYYFYGPQSAITQNGLTTDEAIINYVNQNNGASERSYNNVSGYMNGLTPNTAYLLVVVPYNSNDEVGTITKTQFTTPNTNGIEDANEKTYTVSSQDGYLSVGGAEGRMVSVYSIDGRCIFSSRATETTVIDVPTAGVYLVKVDDTPARRVVVR